MLRVAAVVAFLVLAVVSSSGGGAASADRTILRSAAAPAPVAAPRFVRNISTGETGWFSSPGLVDLDGDRKLGDRRALLLDVRLRREGAPARQGHGDERAGLRARRGGRPRRRRTEEIVVGGNEGTVAAYELRGGRATRTGLAGLDLQRGPVPRGSGAGGGRSRRGRPDRGRRDDDEHLADRLAGVRLRPCSLYRPQGAPATAWPRTTASAARATTPTSTAPATTATAPTARTSASATSTTTRSSRSSSPSTTTRSTSSTTTAPPCSPRRGTATARPALGRRLGWGQFIRWLDPAVEARHYHRHAGPWPDVEPDDVAPVDGLAAVGRRPRPRRPERGDRPAERGEEGAVRDPGLRVHGARRRARRRLPLGAPARRLRRRRRSPASLPYGLRGLVSAVRDPGTDGRRHRRRSASGDRGLRARRLRLRGQPDGQAALAFRLRPRRAEDVRLRGRGRRPQPRRQARARLRHVRARARLRPAGRALANGQAAARHPAPAPGHETGTASAFRRRPRSPTSTATARSRSCVSTFDHGIDVFRVPRSGTNLLPWPTGRGSLLRNGTGPATAR